MKILIDEVSCKKNGLNIPSVLVMLLIRYHQNITDYLRCLQAKNLIVREGNEYFIASHEINDKLDRALMGSDESIPEEKTLVDLAQKIRAEFPKGVKTGNTTWRCNLRDLTLRLQRFMRVYGNTYTPEQMIEATKKYVASFHGDYTYMRTCKYFIMKQVVETDEAGNKFITDVSELATWLENDDIQEKSLDKDWTATLM